MTMKALPTTTSARAHFLIEKKSTHKQTLTNAIFMMSLEESSTIVPLKKSE